MKKITLEEAFAKQLEGLKAFPGLTQEDLDISFENYKNKNNLLGAPDDLVKHAYDKRKFYSDGTEKRVGDKLVFYLIPQLDETEENCDMKMTSCASRKINELETEYDFFENISSDNKVSALPVLAKKGSKESKAFEERKTLFGNKNE